MASSLSGISGGLQGTPPPEFQCIAIKRNGQRCKGWRCRGARTCRFHNGKKRKYAVPVSHLPGFYSKVLGKTLQDAFHEALDTPPAEQLQLFEELALLRLQAKQVVALYNAAVESGKVEATMAAGAVMRDALEAVATMSTKAAAVERASKESISVHHITFIINQITRIAHDVMKGDIAKAREFEERVRETVRLPSSGVDGTLITPDQDVIDMDSTIPSVEDLANDEP